VRAPRSPLSPFCGTTHPTACAHRPSPILFAFAFLRYHALRALCAPRSLPSRAFFRHHTTCARVRQLSALQQLACPPSRHLVR
jgi:hypothetical protein